MDEHFQPLAPVARWFWILRGAIPLVLLGTATGVALVVMDKDRYGLLAALVTVVLVLWWSVLAQRRYRAWGYAELDKELMIRQGVLIQRLSVVPYGRMQFIDVFQGPIDRMLHVSTVKLHTAAAATDATIPFVAESEAKRLRERLTELGESHGAGL